MRFFWYVICLLIKKIEYTLFDFLEFKGFNDQVS